MTVSPSFPLSVSPSPAVASGAPAFNFPGWRPSPSPSGPVPVNMLGVPFDRVSTADTLAAIGRMIESRRPHFIATANVDFLVQARADRELRRILCEADLVLCEIGRAHV